PRSPWSLPRAGPGLGQPAGAPPRLIPGCHRPPEPPSLGSRQRGGSTDGKRCADEAISGAGNSHKQGPLARPSGTFGPDDMTGGLPSLSDEPSVDRESWHQVVKDEGSHH